MPLFLFCCLLWLYFVALLLHRKCRDIVSYPPPDMAWAFIAHWQSRYENYPNQNFARIRTVQVTQLWLAIGRPKFLYGTLGMVPCCIALVGRPSRCVGYLLSDVFLKFLTFSIVGQHTCRCMSWTPIQSIRMSSLVPATMAPLFFGMCGAASS